MSEQQQQQQQQQAERRGSDGESGEDDGPWDDDDEEEEEEEYGGRELRWFGEVEPSSSRAPTRVNGEPAICSLAPAMGRQPSSRCATAPAPSFGFETRARSNRCVGGLVSQNPCVLLMCLPLSLHLTLM